MKFCREHIAAKTATIGTKGVLTSTRSSLQNSSAEAVEMHLYMLEIFTDHDTDKDVIIKLVEFNAMMIQGMMYHLLQLLTPGICHLVKEGLVSVPHAYLGH